MAVIPFDVGEDVIDLLTDKITTINGVSYQNGRVDRANYSYSDCITIYINEGVRSEKEVRKLDECEREYIEYATKLRQAV